MGMIVNYAPGSMCKQMIPAHRKVRNFPHFVWGTEEDLKYQNNQFADEKITQEYPDDESNELTTTLWRLFGWFEDRDLRFFSTNCTASYIQLNGQANEVIELYTTDC
jgi:hypothetical protein